ncbi:MAG: galactokinase [Lachnospiraceae bacterium]|nr:galactokinase [Lachnospiraceae bacterium]
MNLKKEFERLYGAGEPAVYYAPGRVNLIGEHIDYNGGQVFPCALSFGTYGAVRLRKDRRVRFASLNFPQRAEISLDNNEYDARDGWANYPKGVIKEFQLRGHRLQGMDILLQGEIPNGSGLSSSASVEVLIATMLNDLFGTGYDKVTLVQLCQHSENTFNGVNCGIMDQFAVGLGRESQAILLDCATLAYRYAPLNMEGVRLVIGNTKKRRGLADSKYNERRAECEMALRDLQKKLDIKALCDLTPAEFEAHKHLIVGQVSQRRAEHAVYENERVHEAVRALEKGDMLRFGQLMNESHDSLRDLYEVTGTELDTMVEEARRIPGTLGSRMTGAGFGGCTVSLVKEEDVERFIREVGEAYEARTGLTPEFYVAQAGQGAGRIDEPIEFLIEELLAYGLDKKLIERTDAVYVRNQLLELLRREAPYEKTEGVLPCREAFSAMRKQVHGHSPYPVLKKILDYMVDRGLIAGESITLRDLMDAKIMGLLTPRPSEVQHEFERLRQESPEQASEYFYQLSRDNHYVMEERVAKNLYWQTPTPYGDLEITINLSKPEKDPREIAKLKFMKASSYPKCLLCPENVGYAGRLNHPARQNLRQLALNLQAEEWYLQYSPYVYYQEHCILLKGEHVPMKIEEKTFRRLIQFIELLPHYFMGSNAGLPVVGGSILNHEHYQGGHHVFPMEKARARQFYQHADFPDVSVSVINWQMSCIRMSGADKEALIGLAAKVLHFWEQYSDERVGIFAETDGQPHNAITPIARFNQKGEYELDLVLRNNLTTEEYPDGVFHPHPELHHIKKENIGLIEVMGLAVLPGRLQKELELIQGLLMGGDLQDLSEEEKGSLEKHAAWIDRMQERYGCVKEEKRVREILQQEVGELFSKVLEDAGVYKNTPEGVAAFDRFMLTAGFLRK